MLGHSTLRKHLLFGGHKGLVKKAYVHRASKGSNPLGVLLFIQHQSQAVQELLDSDDERSVIV
jgi:hypothetical protein